MLIIGCIFLKLIVGTITRGLISGSSVASHAGVFRGAPLKTPAWEARSSGAPNENIVQNHLNIAF